MIREQVVITEVWITKAGQVKHFQVKLPKNTTRIIGVELGGRWLTETKGDIPIPSEMPKESAYVELKRIEAIAYKPVNVFKRNLLIGEVKLQSCEEANIFYAADIQVDSNMGYADFSQNSSWRSNVFTHQTQSFEECVIVDGESTILQGMYKDRYGEQTKLKPNYLVNVYVWTERQEPENKK